MRFGKHVISNALEVEELSRNCMWSHTTHKRKQGTTAWGCIITRCIRHFRLRLDRRVEGPPVIFTGCLLCKIHGKKKHWKQSFKSFFHLETCKMYWRSFSQNCWAWNPPRLNCLLGRPFLAGNKFPFHICSPAQRATDRRCLHCSNEARTAQDSETCKVTWWLLWCCHL